VKSSVSAKIGIFAAAAALVFCGAWGCGRAPHPGTGEKPGTVASSSAPVTRGDPVAAEGGSNAGPAARDVAETASAHLDRGKALLDDGDSQGAIAACSKAIALAPDLAEAYCVRGLAYQNAGRNDLAIADLTTAIEKRPDFTDAYNARGLTYLLKCDYARTRSDLRKVVELDPDGKMGASAKENLELLGPE